MAYSQTRAGARLQIHTLVAHHLLHLTNVLVQGTDESGGEDVPFLAAELHGRLNAIIHHQCEELMNRVRAKV